MADKFIIDAEFNEADHPRDPDGKFGSGGGGSSSKPKLNATEKSRVTSYTGDDFYRINKELRAGESGGKDAAELDKIISKGTIPAGSTLYRGMDTDAAKKLFKGGNINAGDEISDPAFMSTAAERTTQSAPMGGVSLEIEVSTDHPGLDVSELSNNKHEKEVLLPRNTKLVVTSVVAPKKIGDPIRVKVKTIDGKQRSDADETLPPVSAPAEASPVAPKAAGILFKAQDGQILLLRRGNGGDYPGCWAVPGGHLEDGEDAEQAARREALEETGFNFKGDVKVLHDDGTFTTFLADWSDEPFDVKICPESDGHVWASADTMPEPMHPGCANTMRVLGADTELAVADLIRDGILPSPQKYGEMWLFDIRITGTGTAYRGAKKGEDGKVIRDAEHVLRPPEHYLTEEFLRRCNGLPVLFEHPLKSMLNSKEFSNRVIGSVFVPYIKGEEVWGISKIYDAPAAEIMCKEQLSTSPGVILSGDNIRATLDTGEAILIEGKPRVLDHIAVCSNGVWDKGGEPTGVNSTLEIMDMATETEEEKKARETADAARKDADKEEMKKMVADAVSSCMADAMEKFKKDSAPLAATATNDPAKPLPVADADEEKKKAEEKAMADKAKKDAEEKEKEKADAMARADAAEKERPLFAECQARADSVFSMFGERAPANLPGESFLAYKRRLISKMQQHSPRAKTIDLAVINDAAALGHFEELIYADAADAARNPIVPAGQLREVKRQGPGGHLYIDFYGDSRACWSPFMGRPITNRIRVPQSMQ